MINMPLKWHHIAICNKNCRKCVDKDFGSFVLIRNLTYDAFMWNWSKSTLCDDASFIAIASTMHLKMKSNGPHLKRRLPWVHICKSY
jgi:hypothetical protein